MNRKNPTAWPSDIARSVAEYNAWFKMIAPMTFREVREESEGRIAQVFDITAGLSEIDGASLRDSPWILPILRMCMAPPLAVDRLVGLSDAMKGVVGCMEEGKRPPRLTEARWNEQTDRLAALITQMLDIGLFPWLVSGKSPSRSELDLAIAVVSDRLCISIANPRLRNAQEQRQLDLLERWLLSRKYRRDFAAPKKLRSIPPGTYQLRMNVMGGADCSIIVTIDAVIQPHILRPSGLPLLVEAKSAGDFTNVNKRRKEESDKVSKLRQCNGEDVEYVLLLGGYFDENYLAYEANAGIEFVWEHRLDDFTEIGL